MTDWINILLKGRDACASVGSGKGKTTVSKAEILSAPILISCSAQTLNSSSHMNCLKREALIDCVNGDKEVEFHVISQR